MTHSGLARAFGALAAKIALSAVLLANFSANARTLSEALGYSPDQKILIVHADDLGSITSANHAIKDLLNYGIVRSTSIMMPCPGAADAVNEFRDSGADVGVHTTLTSEWKSYRWGPVSPVEDVPSLVEPETGFLHNGLFWLFVWGRLPDVRTELEAQVQAALAAGLSVTHIDNHMGSIFLHPSWLQAYLSVARKYHLAPMVPRWSQELKRNFFGALGGDLMDVLSETGLFSASAILDKAEEAGFLPVDHLYMFPAPIGQNGFAERKKFYLKLLTRLKPGVSEILIHPAYNDQAFTQILRSNPEQVLRDYEARIFQDPEIRTLIDRENIRLIGWRQIQQAYDWSRVTEPHLD